jgi:phenylalanyl-tRNA synthetase beta chain
MLTAIKPKKRTILLYLLVPVAMIGADLPGGVHIKKGKLRGVESNGMLCSLGELGLTKHDFPYAIEDGIFLIEEDCKPGQDIHEAIGLDDTSVEFEITSNRPDCLSVVGLAREAAVTFGKPLNLKAPEFHGSEDKLSDSLAVAVENTQLCPRYIAGMVKNVKIGPSPRWMRERLRASGVRPINNLVDITNYVMLEYGQPMHAFDQRYVKDGKIVVRNAKDGEAITTLDGQERQLSPEMLIIADAEKPIAVAGVMGGEYSGIMDDTNTVIFESAYFEPVQVRRTAKKLGMRTDASARYEKGLDPDGCQRTLKRAMELVELLGAGEPVAEFIEVDNRTAKPAEIPFDPDWINRFLGTEISREEMVKTLESLDIQVKGDVCVSPSFRIDLERPADIAEEVARIYGYNNIPSTVIRGVAEAQLTPQQQFLRKAEQTMVGLGYYGTLTYSFTSPKCFDRIGLPADSKLRKTITITNPLGEDTSIMRTTTLPCMLDVLATNYKNRNAAVALYEIGKEYLPTGPDTLPNEPNRLTIGMYGGDADFFALKGTVDALLKELRLPKCTYVRPSEAEGVFEECCALHPGRSAVILSGETPIGYLGELHPTVQKTYGIGTRTYVAKLLVQEMAEMAEAEVTYRPLPKFPAITRDLSLLCDDALPVGKMEEAIEQAAGKLLEEVTLFDVYKGDQIAAGKKSVSFSLRLRSHEGTLTDEQADAAMKRVLKALAAMDAVLREA